METKAPSKLRESLVYFRERSEDPSVREIHFNIHWRPNQEERFHVCWNSNDEEDSIAFDLAIAFGTIVGAFNRSRPDRLPTVFMWFNSDSIASYQFEQYELDSLHSFLNKIKFSIENYLAFYR